jgi:SH3 domain-containing YSC84-like protein 1
MDSYWRSARAVAIFPKVVRAGFIVGGSGGKGVLSARTASGEFSAPVFYTLGGGSVGLQVGYDEATVVMFLMTDQALRSALNGETKVGGSISATAGSKEGENQATTASDIVYYADASGLFAGISLDGAVLSLREQETKAFYGANATPTAILIENRFDRPGTEMLKQALMGNARVSAVTR